MTDSNSKLQEFHATSAQLIRAVIQQALRDTAPCHWRVVEGQEDGAQLVRASDLMAWAEKTASELEKADD